MTARLADVPVLDTDRLTLRAPQASDFGAFAAFATSDRARYVGGGADKDIGHAWRMLAVISGHWHLRGYGTFVLEDKATGRSIGSAGPWHPGDWPETELGWTIWTEAAEGQGYAYEACVALRRHSYAELGWSTAVSYIDAANTRSQALAQRLGCQLDPDAARPDRDVDIQVWRHPDPAEVLA